MTGDPLTSLTDNFFLIAGPCVVEEAAIMDEIADTLAAIRDRFGIATIFKASALKANRSSGESYRGPGWTNGLAQLAAIRARTGLSVLTDIHETPDAAEAAAAVDILQIPALLSRQTALIEAAAVTGKPLLVKKGQFMAGADMAQVVAKIERARARAGLAPVPTIACERGNIFGYQNIVADMRNLAIMRAPGVAVAFDAAHTVQLPSSQGAMSGGQPQFSPLLARAAVAAGCDGLFIEVHPDPASASSDPATSMPLHHLPALVEQCVALHRLVREGQMLDLDARLI
ncbi:3-deoxy-8-phosphooctulonate synthase [Sphingopyxis sp. QXT-31]|uniref:3-deoxy-8-phosphooctulonate synthase n=1 Tax=Sphingopyxis sp. QXT-31 TaxID=1357916 RepID=UPI000979663C|nr:3-deoxy-8-phosphooctulonate synthase [Sphingopyxis sp. QXT-31]APZ98193.1 3-deoxy-8-phosphooctulonate synthase [Sphingopyxis sp. QXT-31]